MSLVLRYRDLRFEEGGRARPFVDCFGFYRLFVADETGVLLPVYAGGGAAPVALAARRAAKGRGSWRRIEPGQERRCDAVLMWGLLERHGRLEAAEYHVGAVVDEGRMIDFDTVTGLMLRPFRTTKRVTAMPTVASRVLSIWRPLQLEDLSRAA